MKAPRGSRKTSKEVLNFPLRTGRRGHWGDRGRWEGRFKERGSEYSLVAKKMEERLGHIEGFLK